MIQHKGWGIVATARGVAPDADGSEPGGIAPSCASLWYRRTGGTAWALSPERSLGGTKRHLDSIDAEDGKTWQEVPASTFKYINEHGETIGCVSLDVGAGSWIADAGEAGKATGLRSAESAREVVALLWKLHGEPSGVAHWRD